MQSKAATVKDYLAELPADRRQAIETVRKVILKNLPKGYEEVMNWGMISYQVPLSEYPDTYNKQPLMYAALASQKNHMAVYLTGLYMNSSQRAAFERDYKASGKKLDMGNSCVRFKTLDALPIDMIGTYIAQIPMEEHIATAKAARQK